MISRLSSYTEKQDKLSRKSAGEGYRETHAEKPRFQEEFRGYFKEDLYELIRSNFPKPDAEDISRAAEQFAEFDRAELNILLHPGKFITKKGKRVQVAYLKVVPAIYKLTEPPEARKALISQKDWQYQISQKEQSQIYQNRTGKTKNQINQTKTEPEKIEQTDQDQIKQGKIGPEKIDRGEEKVQINPEFSKWLSIASKASELSFSCFEGFFNSSPVILEKKGPEGLPLLEKWTEIGISLAEKSNQFAIIYFNHTANAVVSDKFSADSAPTSFSGDISSGSAGLEGFREFISFGERFSGLNARLAEVYFEHLPGMLDLLSHEGLRLFYSITDSLLKFRWEIAADIFDEAKDVFSAIPPPRQKELLTALNKFAGCMETFPSCSDRAAAAPALFKNAPAAMANLDSRGFEAWVSIAEEITDISSDAAVTFLNRSPGALRYLKINELRQWAEKGITLLSFEKQAFESFYESSFKGLEKHLQSLNSEERNLLLDIGAEIALINPGCTGSYFENSPPALRLLSGSEFKTWADTGTGISKGSSSSGSDYFKNSVTSFRKIPASYHAEILETAEPLLEKDWLLAGKFFENLPDIIEKSKIGDIRKWADIGTKIYDTDRNLSVDYFTYSALLLSELDIYELEEWALKGLEIFKNNASLGRPYFSLKSRSSNDFIDELTGGVALKNVANILRYYAMGLSGTSFNIRSKKELPGYTITGSVNPIISGRTIFLEPGIKKYGNFQDNFKIYKLSIMHEVGHARFSSLESSQELIDELIGKISAKYGTNKSFRAKRTEKAEIIEKVEKSERIEKPGKTERIEKAERIEKSGKAEEKSQFSGDISSGKRVNISAIISMFPNKVLAASIFGVLEDARIEYLIMDLYRGVRSDLESIRQQMLLSRPAPEGELEKLMETLLWLSTLHNPPFELAEDTGPIFNKIRTVLQGRVLQPDSSILTSLEATFAIYSLFESILGPLEYRKYEMLKNIEYRGMGSGIFDSKGSLDPDEHRNVIRSFIPENESSSAISREQPVKEETEKEKLEKKPCASDRNWKALGSCRYDEWDCVINDYRSNWCAVNEIEPVGGSGEYYAGAYDRYRNEIALIKNVFTRMKPESFQRLKGQTDGTEIDIDAFSNALIERRCGINPDEKLYVRRDKRKRDVATLFLVDVSASTRKRLGQEESRIWEKKSAGEKRGIEGRKSSVQRRSIIDVEKDALIIMAQALETIGDRYAIYAFSGHTREGVEYYVIKEFDEELSGDVEKRISLLEPIANTRLGAAIRHSIKKLDQVSSETKILILLSDGEPYDTCYGEGAYQGKYAEEDTKIAIQEGNNRGIHFFCITVDSSPGDYLDKIFSDFGYTIIDDARILPERLPILYKRLTT